MNYMKIRKIARLAFGFREIAGALNIKSSSAAVTAKRLADTGSIVRIKRNLYVLRERWDRLDREDVFRLANIIQVPSYISLTTALQYYGITTQVQRDFCESICLLRTKSVAVENRAFNYTKINRTLYFGFVRKDDFFIAEPEKAFLDAIYLSSINRYRIDPTSIDMRKFDRGKLNSMMKAFPGKTAKLLEAYARLKKT